MSSNETKQGLTAFFTQIYRFNPRAIHKAIKYIPLPKFTASYILSFIAPLLVIADIRLPAMESETKFSRLRKEGSGDVLEIFLQESEDELTNQKSERLKISKQLRSLGLFPLKTISGYTIPHYAGGVPFTDIPGKLSADKDGKLHQARRIYIADSSTWRSLPAKPPTLTIMAGASCVGKNVLRRFH